MSNSRGAARRQPAKARGPGAAQNAAAGGQGRRGPTASRPRQASKQRRGFDKRWLAFMPAFALIYVAFTYACMAVTMPAPQALIEGAQGLRIYDRNGELLQEFGDEPGSGRVVPLAEISPAVIDATVSTEDAEFWDNPGVNLKGLARAAYENVAFWETGGFFQGSGGSSITQQLAKNLYISPDDRADRSLLRKARETMIAFELSRRYSKQEILEWYLSNVYYGNGAYGIESASYRYFNKPPGELNLSEATLLAGLPSSPTFYNPISNFEAAKTRQAQVLGLMVRHGFIDQAAMDEALGERLVLDEGRAPGDNFSIEDAAAPHFAQYVRELLPSLIGKDRVKGNLKVTTTLDLRMQNIATESIQTQLAQFDESQNVTNGALVAIEPATGQILAMVGSQDFFRDDISGQVNNATALNQPGSTIKPVTYLTAFLNGATPDHTVLDEPIEWSGAQGDVLGNADGWYRGEVTLRTGLASSLNVPAVKVLRSVGLSEVVEMARKLGVTSLESDTDYGSAFTLGAFDVSLLDMTYVYSVLANRGEQTGIPSVLGLSAGARALDPVAVLKVETSDGDVIWEADQRSLRVAPEEEVHMLSTVLSDDEARSSMFGYNSPLHLPRPAAVKSGSTDETRDAWTIGYTPQLVAGVWVGNADNSPIPNGTSTYTAAPIWREFMLTALDGEPTLGFADPGAEQVPDAPPPPPPPPEDTQVPPTQPPATQAPATPEPATEEPFNAGLRSTPTVEAERTPANRDIDQPPDDRGPDERGPDGADGEGGGPDPSEDEDEDQEDEDD